MNVKLLRRARRDSRGIRYWIVPGFGNGVRLVPSALTPHGWGPAVYWPAMDDKGPLVEGVDLDRHRTIAKHEIRALIVASRKRARQHKMEPIT